MVHVKQKAYHLLTSGGTEDSSPRDTRGRSFSAARTSPNFSPSQDRDTTDAEGWKLGRAKGHLDEANVLGVLPEALAADVEAVLADEAPLVGAHTAATT